MADGRLARRPSMLESSRPTGTVLQSETGEESPIVGHPKEQLTLESVLTDIVGSIVEDPEFVSAIKHMRDEAIPFYAQLPDVHNGQSVSPPAPVAELESADRMVEGSLTDDESRLPIDEVTFGLGLDYI